MTHTPRRPLTDRERFILAIRAEPDADVPRLVFADWLEERGETRRAKFIRDHVRLHAIDPTGSSVGSEQYADVPAFQTTERDRLLVKVTAYTSDSANPDVIGRPFLIEAMRTNCLWWDRGFVSQVNGPLDVLREHLPELLREHPLRFAYATDKRPWLVGGRHGFGTEADPNNVNVWISPYDSGSLPFDLQPRLFAVTGEYSWPTSVEAMTALSAVLLAEAEEKAFS